MSLELLAGVGLGFGVGVVFLFFAGVKPLVNKIAAMRYDGFRPIEPPPLPKTRPALYEPRDD